MRFKLPNLRNLRRPKMPANLLADLVKFITLAIALFIIFMLFRITSQNNTLALEAKHTADQNQSIAKANGQHIDCIAKLFAQYTQNNTPITSVDLDKCKITQAEMSALMSGAVDFTSLQTTTTPAPTNQKTNNSTQQNTSQGNNPTNKQTTPEQGKNNPKQPKELLGVPLCVPTTGRCLR